MAVLRLGGHPARDNYTLPSSLSRHLCKSGYGVEVTNFAQIAYLNNQEMIQLILELKRGNIPDIVIFYDGVNDVFTAYQNNLAGVPQNIANRKIEFNLRERFNIINPIIKKSNFILLTNKILMILFGFRGIYYPTLTPIANKESLSSEVIDGYFSNIDIIKSLEDNYHFRAFFFWQPLVYTKNKTSETEDKIISREGEEVKDFFELVYSKIKTKKDDHFYDISDIFDDIDETLYADFAHISEESNELVARKIAEKIIPYLK